MLKMLIVDDQKKELEGICSILKWEDYNIEIIGCAENGQDGLNKALDLKPDIIITDVVMPLMDGLSMIEEIQKLLPGIKFIICSSYDDFDYIKSALHMSAVGYVLKPIITGELRKTVLKVIELCNKEKQKIMEDEVLEKQLKESLPLLRENFLKNLIYGIYKEEEVIWENIRFLSLDIIPGMVYNILHLEIDNFELLTADFSPQKKQLLLLSIKNIVQEFLSQKQVCYAIPVDESHVSIIMAFSKHDTMTEDNKTLMDITINLVNELKQRLNVTFTVGIGTFTDNILGLERCCRLAKDATLLKFSLGKGQIIRIEDRQIEIESADFRMESIQLEVKSLLVSGNTESIQVFIDNFITPENRSYSEDYTQFVCTCIISSAHFALIEMGESLKSIFDNEFRFYEKIYHMETIVDLKQWLKNILTFIQDFVQKKKNMKNRRVVDRIKDIIKVRYSQDLSIDEIAQEICLSPSYTSYIFKHETGENIIEYLTKVRIDRAMELLKNPSYKIYDIASMVGYSNNNYFWMVFKERVNMTPKEYRGRF